MLAQLLLVCLLGCVAAIPVDNGVEGEPEIECGPTAITINFNTQQAFEGHVYVKGRYFEEGCRSDEGGRRVAGISLPFSDCGVSRTRSLNPKGVFVSTTVVVTFHPLFITKVDRAYKIQCFYMEADKTVSTEIEVSMLTTGFQTQFVPMPVCRYEILDGGPTGAPVQYALVGDQVYHKWTCDTETVDTFCMSVYGCFVDDGQGDSVELLDAEGCALDRFLLNNLEYPSDLMAGQEAHVFKYADRPQLFFQCQIAIVVKEPGEDCPRPQCGEPARGKRAVAARHARSTKQWDVAGTWDVQSQQISTLDLSDNVNARLPHAAAADRSAFVDPLFYRPVQIASAGGVCLSHTGFAGLVGALVMLLVSAVVISALIMSRRNKF